MNPLLVALALVIASCGSEAEEPRGESPQVRSETSAPGGSETVEPVTGDVASSFCGSAHEARIRAAHPEIPACMNRAFVVVEGRVGEHDLLVLGHAADACCDDVPSPGTMLGALVFVDGASTPADVPLALEARALSSDEAAVLLSAELLRLWVIHQALDQRAVGSLREAWPVTAPVLRAHPPGLTRTQRGWRLRVASESSDDSYGVTCRSLAIWEAELDDGLLRTQRIALHSDGAGRAGPCPGEPFPQR